jgi:AraC-like DNA-binding protein
MSKNQNIPIHRSESFGKVYFDEAPGKQVPVIHKHSTQYFDIHQRCNGKSAIDVHRLDFYMVFLVTEGEGLQTFGLQEHYIRKNMLCFVSPDMISAWKAEGDEQRGYYCSFSDDFFNLGRENKSFLHELPFFQIDGNAVLHLTDEQTTYYLTLFEMMHTEFKQHTEFSGNILRGHLYAILNKANAQYQLQATLPAESNRSSIRLLKSFTGLYMRDFKTINTGNVIKLKKIADYADELGVSQNHLNDTIKALTGKSAGQLIKDQLIKQATMCLRHSHKSISEIAYRLGYDDPSYFARYYKSQTGKTPIESRNNL